MGTNPKRTDEKKRAEPALFLRKLQEFNRSVDRLNAAHQGLNTSLIPVWLEAGLPLSNLIEDSGYGETPIRLVQKIFDLMAFQAGDVFLDLGCGTNQIAALLTLADIEAYGIERNPKLCHLARVLSEWTETYAQTLEADFLKLDWPPANKIYSATQRISDSTLARMTERLRDHEQIQTFCALGKSLPGLEEHLRSTSQHDVQWNLGETVLETHLYLYRF